MVTDHDLFTNSLHFGLLSLTLYNFLHRPPAFTFFVIPTFAPFPSYLVQSVFLTLLLLCPLLLVNSATTFVPWRVPDNEADKTENSKLAGNLK
jgi:hypothetical protein